MKKLFSIFALTMVIGLFSSCIIIGVAEEPEIQRYNITCHNESDRPITDWCVVRNGSVTYAKSQNNYCRISSNGGTATLYGLPAGDYVLYVAFTDHPKYANGDYVESKPIKLNKDYNVFVDQTFVDTIFN